MILTLSVIRMAGRVFLMFYEYSTNEKLDKWHNINMSCIYLVGTGIRLH